MRRYRLGPSMNTILPVEGHSRDHYRTGTGPRWDHWKCDYRSPPNWGRILHFAVTMPLKDYISVGPLGGGSPKPQEAGHSWTREVATLPGGTGLTHTGPPRLQEGGSTVAYAVEGRGLGRGKYYLAGGQTGTSFSWRHRPTRLTRVVTTDQYWWPPIRHIQGLVDLRRA